MTLPVPRTTWFLPTIKAGSGGLRTVLAHAKFFETKGFSTCLQVDGREIDAQTAHRKISEFYGYSFSSVRLGWTEAEPCDLAIATVWPSALPVAKLPFATKRLYYVQDFEPWFYPMGSMYLAAESSYSHGLDAVTIGRFLARKLEREYKLRTAYHDFGANPDIYRPLELAGEEKPPQKNPAVCFLFQPGKERRASELGLAALRLVSRLRPEVTIYLYGTPPAENVHFQPPFHFLDHMGLEECNNLYNQCTLGLCLSCTNPSRVPFEMMASGLPVVDLWRENTRYDFPEEAIYLAAQTPEDIASSIVRLLDKQDELARMREAGLKFMRRRTEEMESTAFAGIIRRWFETNSFPAAQDIQPMYTKPPKGMP